MTDSRYKFLMGDDPTSDDLTEQEIKQGWHYCYEFDGLLIGPGMDEMKYCHCFSLT